MPDTLADKWRVARRKNYASTTSYIEEVLELDENAEMKSVNGRAVIAFSDGSEYVLAAPRLN